MLQVARFVSGPDDFAAVRLPSAEESSLHRDDRQEAPTASANALVLAAGFESMHSFSVKLSAFVEVDKPEARSAFCVTVRLALIVDDKPAGQRVD